MDIRQRMGAASRAIISRWSYAECAAGLEAALARSGVAAGRVAASALGRLITNPTGLEMTAPAPFAVKLALLGTSGGTHIGGSFARGAAKLGIRSIYFDVHKAWAGQPLRLLSWHLADRRPFHLNQFSNALVKACARAKPEILVATGMAPLTDQGCALRQLGIVSVNYSTDDPWIRPCGRTGTCRHCLCMTWYLHRAGQI
jgi:hypothetical protein